VHIKQFGTALFLEALGGPLAVNAFGTARSGTVGLAGGQVGYQWSPFNVFNSLSAIAPATELEGYYLGKGNFTGHDVNNDTTRLAEHDFLNTYPLEAGIFLANAVANFNFTSQSWFNPYIGAGIGAGVLSIKNADSLQVSPLEAGINHYNTNTNSSNAVFAGQVKTGLNVHLTPNIDVFGEYRWLYLSGSNHTFGSTDYPGHAVTSSWLVKFDSQNYNLGAVGVRYSV
jgi:opacity protein-like surface antigen